MAGSSGKYVKTKSSNPFLDDDDLEDVDDETFLQKSPNKSILNSGGLNLGGASSRYKYSNLSSERSAPAADSAGMTASPSSDSIEDRRQRLLLEKQRVEQRTLESSNRSIGVLFETEQVGSAAAEELLRQREQLERTGSRLDEMNNSLRSSEKHIQNIKSVFSSIKNYFSKPNEPTRLTSDAGPVGGSTLSASGSSSSSQLSKVLESKGLAPQQLHPGLRTRGVGADGDFGRVSDVDDKLDENLGVMSQSLSRLKGLAQGLNSELDDQDKLLDRLQISTDKADWRIQRQNKDMERLLKK